MILDDELVCYSFAQVFVSKKRKLQAAKQKREVVFAEVRYNSHSLFSCSCKTSSIMFLKCVTNNLFYFRFLRRKHKYLLKREAPNTDKETTALQGGGNPIPSTIDQPLLSDSLRVNIIA